MEKKCRIYSDYDANQPGRITCDAEKEAVGTVRQSCENDGSKMSCEQKKSSDKRYAMY